MKHNEKVDEKTNDFMNRAYQAHLYGIQVARAVAEHECMEDISDEALFARGGAIGTSMMIELSKQRRY